MKIVYKDLSKGSVDICRSLCNQLMSYQSEKAILYKDILSSMNFENRLKPSFENSKEKYLSVAFDGQKPIGYVFATSEMIDEETKTEWPTWAEDIPKDTRGFYPEKLSVPSKIGTFSNLYVLPEYRGYHVGRELTNQAMKWLKNLDDVEYIFVYVSNGNNVAPFYKSYGFTHSHEVFGGMIEAYKMKI